MDAASGRVVGRYVLYDEIASGGMATVHLGRMLGQVGFARIVAVKRLHPHLARDPEFVAMFLDEARLAAGVRHPNVVATLDVVAITGELFLVMEYVEGDSLSHLIRATRRRKEYVPPAIVSSIACGMLYGLHAAHGAHDERGAPLKIVHRDVSPQNILIGIDGATRVADFGVAKASRRLMETEAGRMKGKFSYMSPEQVRRDTMDQRADVFSAGICTWEAFTGRHLFTADDPARAIVKLLEMPIEPPSRFAQGISPEVDAIVLRALERDPEKRFQSAREMAMALEDALPPAIPRKVGEWVESLVGPLLEQRSRRLAEMQLDSQSESELQQIAREISSQSVAPPPNEPVPAAADGEIEDESPVADAESAPAEEASDEPASAPSEDLSEAPPSSVPVPALDGAPPLYSADHGTPVSQMSGLLSASYTEPPPLAERARSLPVIALVAALGVIVLGSIVIVASSSPSETSSAASAASASAPSVQPAKPGPADPRPAAQTPAPKAEPDKAPEIRPSPEPARAAESQPPPAKSARESEPAPPPKVEDAPAKPVAKPVAPKGSCNPPYTIENGIKKFKRHCI